MMFDIIPTPIRNFIDALFSPAKSFLQLLVDLLSRAGTVAGKGINLNNYFGWFAYLPPSMQAVVQSFLASVVLLAILFLIRAVWDAYLKAKASGKWW